MEENINVLDQSLKYFENRQLALFFGAGISKIAGCKSWVAMIEDLVRNPRLETIADKDEFVSSLEITPEDKIEICKRELSRIDKVDDYRGVLRSALLENPELFTKKYIPFVDKLKLINPFPIILTTNIDNCLEKTRLLPLNKIFYRKEQFITSNLESESIFHIHGYIEDLDNAVFAKGQYREWYNDDNFKNFLYHIFGNYCVIFLGYGLNDNELTDIIFDVRSKACKIPHFVLFPVEDNLKTSKIVRIEDLLNINIIIYGRRDDFSMILHSWIERNFPEVTK